MEFLSILMDIHIHLDPKPLPCHFRSDPASAFALASEPLSGSDRPPLWRRNNKIIPTLTIILPTSASSAAFVFSHPSNLICVHASISDLLPVWSSPPAPKEEEATLGGHRSALHAGSMSPNARREHIQGLPRVVRLRDRTAHKFLNYHFCGFYVFICDVIDNPADSRASLAFTPPICLIDAPAALWGVGE